MEKAKTYDDSFQQSSIDSKKSTLPLSNPGLNYLQRQQKLKQQQLPQSDGPVVYTGSTGFGDSKYDEGTPYGALGQLGELRAQRQSWGAKAGAGVLRTGAKIVAEVAKMPGYLGGAVGGLIAEDGKGWETFVNNSFLQKVNEQAEDLNDEFLPVYVKDSVKKGNILDNIFSVDFWATEGADGVGFLASMLVPGMAIKGLGLASKVGKGIGAIAKMSDKVDDIVSLAVKAGINPKNVELVTQTVANTLFEAGAEANSAGMSYEARMKPQLDAGLISQQEYNMGKAQAMRNVFVANTLILMGPNALMSKMIWGKKGATASGKFTGDQITGKAKLLEMGKRAVPVAFTEGAWEEGMQSTVEEKFVGDAIAGRDFSFKETLSTLHEDYMHMLGTVEGQKAMFLGAVLGGGMSMYQSHLEIDAENKNKKEILEYLGNVSAFTSLYSEDIYDAETGKLDPNKMAEKLRGIESLDRLSKLYDRVVESKDTDAIEGIYSFALGQLAQQFVGSGEMGINAFKEYLEGSIDVQTIADKNNISKEEVVSDAMEIVNGVTTDYNIINEFADGILNVKNKDATKEMKSRYYQRKRALYLNRKNNQRFYKKLIAKKMQLRKDFLEANNMPSDAVLDDVRTVELEKDNFALRNVSNDVREIEKLLKESEKQIEKFWKSETHQKEFDKFVKDELAMQEALKSVEEAAEAQTAIDNAETAEELADVPASNNPTVQAGLELAKKKKEAELKKKKEEEAAAKTQAAAQTSTKEKEEATAKESKLVEFANRVAENKKVGEVIEIDVNTSEEFYTQVGVVGLITDNEVVIVAMDRERQQFRLPRKLVSAAQNNPQVPEDNFRTEGALNETPSKEGDNIIPGVTPEEGTGAKLISTDRFTGELFPFVSQAYRDHELNGQNKAGNEVSVQINQDPGTNPDIVEALRLFNDNNFEDLDLLINYLPLDAVVAPGVFAPMETRPKETATKRIATFNTTSKVLRTKIINALAAGTPLSDIKLRIEGQLPGALQIDRSAIDGYTENDIRKLQVFNEITDETQALKEIQKNIGFVQGIGTLSLLNGDKIEFNKPESKGSIFLRIPMANGESYPLKLNIRKVNEGEANLLTYLYEKRIMDAEVGKDARVVDVLTAPEMKRMREQFIDVLKIIGKGVNDVTVKDITDFFIWDRPTSVNTRVSFVGDGKGKRKFVYGNPSGTGREVRSIEEFDKDHFKNWLMTNKRININVKNKPSQKNNVSIEKNLKYLAYLLDNKILSTNAVVDKPTFGGYANMYLDINTIDGAPIAVKPRVTKSKNAQAKEESSSEGFVAPADGEVTIDMTQFGFPPASAKTTTKTTTTKPKAPSKRTTKEIKAIKEELKIVAANKELFEELEENAEFYIHKTEKDENGEPVKYRRISNVIDPTSGKPDKNNPIVSSSLVIGSKLDAVVRDIFNNKLKPLTKYDVAVQPVLKPFVEKMLEIKANMDKRGEKVIGDDVLVYDKETLTAGTVDLITVDRNGDVRIYDLKTFRVTNGLTHKTGDNVGQLKYETPYKKGLLSPREKHINQLSGYRILLFNTHNILAKDLGIMLVHVSYPDVAETTSMLDVQPGIPVKPLDFVADLALKETDERVSSPSLENNEEIIRKSPENFVSSHEVPNTEENKKVEETKQNNTPETGLTQEMIKQINAGIFNVLIQQKLIKASASTMKLLQGESQEVFIKLKKLAEQHNVNVDEIITKCK